MILGIGRGNHLNEHLWGEYQYMMLSLVMTFKSASKVA